MAAFTRCTFRVLVVRTFWTSNVNSRIFTEKGHLIHQAPKCFNLGPLTHRLECAKDLQVWTTERSLEALPQAPWRVLPRPH